MAVIKSKSEFATLSNRGRLGNFLKSWPNFSAYIDSGYVGYTTIRSRTPGSPHFISVVEPGRNSVANAIASLLQKGAAKNDLYIQQIPDPKSARRIQFEAMQDSETYIHLYYELDTIEPLRGIRDRGFHVTGIRAARILRDYLYADSFETVSEIWQEYPTAIIEATEFSTLCGAFNRNLVVWEVRDF